MRFALGFAGPSIKAELRAAARTETHMPDGSIDITDFSAGRSLGPQQAAPVLFLLHHHLLYRCTMLSTPVQSMNQWWRAHPKPCAVAPPAVSLGPSGAGATHADAFSPRLARRVLQTTPPSPPRGRNATQSQSDLFHVFPPPVPLCKI